MRNRVKVAIAGVGNCASALIQGTIFYIHKKQTEIRDNNTMIDGLLSYSLGGIEPGDIEFVAAFDVVESKVGKDLADAIFSSPNNTIKICDVPKTGVNVDKGEVFDGIGKHLNERVKISDKKLQAFQIYLEIQGLKF